MVEPLETLTLAERKFVVGRWVGVVALSAISLAVPDADADADAVDEAERKIGGEFRDVTGLVQENTARALGNGVEDLDAYLLRMGSEVAGSANSGTGVPSGWNAVTKRLRSS